LAAAATHAKPARDDVRATTQLAFVFETIDDEANRIESSLEIGAGPAYASILLGEHLPGGRLTAHVCEPGEIWSDHYSRNVLMRVAQYFPFETARKYDYVHASHWLEHVADLGQTIRDLSAVIEEEGFLFIEVPNTGHDYWELPGSDVPHIHFFTIDSVAQAFGRAGFKIEAIGEFGISARQRARGTKIRESDYGSNPGGLWIRALIRI
jgi:hypothetical protein